jgi:hypothetical protein
MLKGITEVVIKSESDLTFSIRKFFLRENVIHYATGEGKIQQLRRKCNSTQLNTKVVIYRIALPVK